MPDDGMRHELVRGDLSTMTPPGFEHGEVALTVGALLCAHAQATDVGRAVGEAGFLLERDPDTVRVPDAAFVRKERFEAVSDTKKYWPGPPDLAVEVISPNDTFRGVQEKAREWVSAGCVAVLVLDPEEHAATVYRAGGESHIYSGDDEVDLSDAAPGFSVTVAEMFA